MSMHFMRTTGRTRAIRREIPAITAGPRFGKARTLDGIQEMADTLGRPAGAHTLVEHQEEITLLADNGGPMEPREIHDWRTVRQERIIPA